MKIASETTTVRGALPTRKVETTIKQVSYKPRRGLKFPFTDSDRGYLSTSVEVDLAKSNLKQLINTRRGERVMLPDFGCDLDSLLFEPFDERLVYEARDRVISSITKYIPYLTIKKIQVLRLEETSRYGLPVLQISLSCQIRDDENTLFDVSVKL